MLFVAIAQHSPAQCPGFVKEAFDAVSATAPKFPELAKKHNINVLGTYVMYSSHKAVTVMDAPSYEAAERFLTDGGILRGNTVELAQAHTIEEAMKDASDRFSGTG